MWWGWVPSVKYTRSILARDLRIGDVIVATGLTVTDVVG